MVKSSIRLILILFLSSSLIKADSPKNIKTVDARAVAQHVLLYGSNIQTPFRNDGIFNYDKTTFPTSVAGLNWPVTSTTMTTIDYSTGLWIASQVDIGGGQHELRTAVAMYNSIFSPGNIPVLGQVPPQSVCNDPSWKPYIVNLIDQSLVNGGVRSRVVGGQTYEVTYDSWADWPVDKGAPYAEVNGVPGYQPGWNADRPGIGIPDVRPSEVCFMVYMDYSNCTNDIHNHEISLPGGTLPMGVEVQQLAYNFNCAGYDNSYFVSWKIMNKSSNVWDSVYIGVVNDADVGSSLDDAAGSDSSRGASFTYNSYDFDTVYGISPPAICSRLIQGPLIFTGNNSDTVRLPYRTYVGYRMMKISSENIFQNTPDPCIGDPDNAEAGYNYLKGLDGCGNPLINPITGHTTKYAYSGDACNRTGWVDYESSDRRTVQSTGPLVINPGDTQVIVMAFVMGRGADNFHSVCDVLTHSDQLNNAYYSGLCSSIIGIRQISNNLPFKYELYQNYPNPFNPVTKIKFDLAGSSNQQVRLVVYDALGRSIATLVDEVMKPGSYETEWNPSNMPSGIYFFRIQAGTFMNTKKMVLIK